MNHVCTIYTKWLSKTRQNNLFEAFKLCQGTWYLPIKTSKFANDVVKTPSLVYKHAQNSAVADVRDIDTIGPLQSNRD